MPTAPFSTQLRDLQLGLRAAPVSYQEVLLGSLFVLIVRVCTFVAASSSTFAESFSKRMAAVILRTSGCRMEIQAAPFAAVSGCAFLPRVFMCGSALACTACMTFIGFTHHFLLLWSGQSV